MPKTKYSYLQRETIEMLKFKRENNQNDEKDNLKIIIQQLESQINKLDEKIEKNIKDTTKENKEENKKENLRLAIEVLVFIFQCLLHLGYCSSILMISILK